MPFTRFCLLLCLLVPHELMAVEPDEAGDNFPATGQPPAASGSEAEEESILPDFSDLLPEMGPLKREKKDFDMISDEEIKPSVRQLPQLVEKIQTEDLASESPYVLLPHRPNYVLPVTYQTKPSNEEQDRVIEHYSDDPDAVDGTDYGHLEAVFQISIKYRLSSGLLGKFSGIDFAYTNRSFWQAYNGDISRPFRETNHEPELIFSWQTENNWIDYFSLAFNHQSNGQSSALSRSWNRIIGQTVSVMPSGVLVLRAWWRIPETSKSDPWDPEDNDNPDIDDYMGPGDITYIYALQNHRLSVMLRNNLNPDDNRGALELGWTFPLNHKLKGYVQYFNGYGESLIDYNRYQERFGVGIKISDWF